MCDNNKPLPMKDRLIINDSVLLNIDFQVYIWRCLFITLWLIDQDQSKLDLKKQR